MPGILAWNPVFPLVDPAFPVVMAFFLGPKRTDINYVVLLNTIYRFRVIFSISKYCHPKIKIAR